MTFQDAVAGLKAGDFSRLEPLFTGSPSLIQQWVEAGFFDTEPDALNEALSCACFNGQTDTVVFLLEHGVRPADGNATGLDAFHWAANRGQLEAVRTLIHHGADLETRSNYGGTVLGTAVWSALNEPKPDHVAIVDALLEAGADVEGASLPTIGFPTGHGTLDAALARHLTTGH